MANLLQDSGQTLITYHSVKESHPTWSDVAIQDYIAQKQDLLTISEISSDTQDQVEENRLNIIVNAEGIEDNATGIADLEANKVDRAGDTMTGNLIIDTGSVGQLRVVGTDEFVDNVIGVYVKDKGGIGLLSREFFTIGVNVLAALDGNGEPTGDAYMAFLDDGVTVFNFNATAAMRIESADLVRVIGITQQDGDGVDDNHLLRKDQIDALDSDRTVWRGFWTEQTYARSDQVSDEGWLAISNQDANDDRAAPQPIGFSDYLLSFTQPFSISNNTSIIASGHEYLFSKGGVVSAARVWVPALGANITYRLVFADATDPNNIVARTIDQPLLLANEWTTISLGSLFVTPADKYFFYIEAVNSASNTPYTGDWQYNGTSNTGAPSPEGWNRRTQNNEVRIDYDDQLSVDRSTNMLDKLIPGSTIRFEEIATPANFLEYEVNGLYTDITGEYFEYPVTLSDSGGTLVAGVQTTISALVPIAASTEYVEDTGWLLANQPDYATVTGILQYDGAAQVAADDAFGVDLKFQEYVTSDKWDIQALSALVINEPEEPATLSVTSASATYQALMSDDGVLCTGTFTVTLPDYAYAIRPVTVASTAGTITVAGDVTIETPVSVTTGTSATWFPAGGQWWLR